MTTPDEQCYHDRRAHKAQGLLSLSGESDPASVARRRRTPPPGLPALPGQDAGNEHQRQDQAHKAEVHCSLLSLSGGLRARRESWVDLSLTSVEHGSTGEAS